MACVSKSDLEVLEALKDAAFSLDHIGDGLRSECVGGSESLTEAVDRLAESIANGLPALGDSLVKAATLLAEAMDNRKGPTP
jgi:hypothetical protein